MTTPPPGASIGVCDRGVAPQPLRSDLLVVVLDSKGRILCSLGDIERGSAPRVPAFTYRDSTKRQSTEVITVRSRDGQSRWRIHPNAVPSKHRTVVTAISLSEADATVSRLGKISLATSLVLLALTGVGGYLLTGVGLRPLRRIETTAERIAAGDLSERVPTVSSATEVVRLSKALNGMLSQIEGAFAERTASEQRLRQFIADASHELRTPIATIRGHAELYRTGVARSQTDVAMVLGRVESEARRVGTLVEDMLLLARLDQARPMERAPIDMLAITAETLIDARARQPARKLRLVPELDESSEPPVVVGDEARLRQVMTNLISNALMHTPESAPVTVRIRTSNGFAHVAVEDQGPGMPDTAVDRVFQRFYRRDTGRSREQGGTGLGLAIVQALITAHGGTVDCTSLVGLGTTFTIHLPVVTALNDGLGRSPYEAADG
jgi:two-component system OmpR family sensor kinase